jgi:hypothetical protein
MFSWLWFLWCKAMCYDRYFIGFERTCWLCSAEWFLKFNRRFCVQCWCFISDDNMPEDKNEAVWFGATLDEIRNGSAPCLPPVMPSHSHTVFFQVISFALYNKDNQKTRCIMQVWEEGSLEGVFMHMKDYYSIFFWTEIQREACSSVIVKALCYKPEGRGFDTRWGDF